MSDTVATLGHVDDYLKMAVDYDASDLHLAVGTQPSWRRFGTLQPIWENAVPLTKEDAERLVNGFLKERYLEMFKERGDVDFAYSNDIGRYRASVVKQRTGWNMCFRVINSTLRSMDELGLPQTLKPLLQYNNGLVLVTGGIGSGKSTTLASMVSEVNHDRDDHIITLEDPVEYLISSAKCHVNQREVRLHTESFGTALRAALREDPDVIMVGEMRDLETISLAITAAETGHLVLATLHTSSAARTLDRILDVFPNDQRDQIRQMVSESLRGIISQQLVPNSAGDGRVLAQEILVNTPAVSASIRDGKTFMIPGIMQTGRNVGMVLMDDVLFDLHSQGQISQDQCYSRSTDQTTMKERLGIA
ncbi:MAG: PilT/PilU family type 4a pilus ATPase [Verrucomicrobiota bacterium]